MGSYTKRISELVRQKASVLSVRKVSFEDKKVEVLSRGVYHVKRAEEPMTNGDKTLEKVSSSEFLDLTKDWVKLNVGQTGFYRVKYDEELASRLRSAISAGSLEATDRFGMCFLRSFPYITPLPPPLPPFLENPSLRFHFLKHVVHIFPFLVLIQKQRNVPV